MASNATARGLSSTALTPNEVHKAAAAAGSAALDGIKLAADIAAKNPEAAVADGVALAGDSSIVVTWCCAVCRRCMRKRRTLPVSDGLPAPAASQAVPASASSSGATAAAASTLPKQPAPAQAAALPEPQTLTPLTQQAEAQVRAQSTPSQGPA